MVVITVLRAVDLSGIVLNLLRRVIQSETAVDVLIKQTKTCTQRGHRRLPKSVHTGYTVLGWEPKADGGLRKNDQEGRIAVVLWQEIGTDDEKEAQEGKTCKRRMVLTGKKSLVTSHIQ